MQYRRGQIARAIDAYLEKGFDRYHTPGHKGGLCARDITEIGESGNQFPADCIEQAQNACARIYGAAAMRFLTNGSSQGIKAALWQFRGKKVLYASGAHRAFAEGCELASVRAVPIQNDGVNANGLVYTCGVEFLPSPVTAEEAERALDNQSDAAALFLTSPDYLGRTADVKIAELCKARGVRLIADGAHGAHFAFAPGLKVFDFSPVADFCNMSAHKTLGAYTQTALLAIGSPDLTENADHALRLLGTTSPNYVWAEELENAVLSAAENGKEYLRLKAFRESVAKAARLLDNTDYTRLCVFPQSGTARELYGRLREKKIMPETVIGNCVVFILTPQDSDEKLDRLYETLKTAAGHKA